MEPAYPLEQQNQLMSSECMVAVCEIRLFAFVPHAARVKTGAGGGR